MVVPSRRRGQAAIFAGMAALAASGICLRFHLDFLAGLCVGNTIPSLFFGFRAFYRS